MELARQRGIGLQKRSAEKERDEAYEALLAAREALRDREKSLEELVVESHEKEKMVNELLQRVVEADAALETWVQGNRNDVITHAASCQTDWGVEGLQDQRIRTVDKGCQTDDPPGAGIPCLTTTATATQTAAPDEGGLRYWAALKGWRVLSLVLLLSSAILMNQSLPSGHLTGTTNGIREAEKDPWATVAVYVDLERLEPGGQVGLRSDLEEVRSEHLSLVLKSSFDRVPLSSHQALLQGEYMVRYCGL